MAQRATSGQLGKGLAVSHRTSKTGNEGAVVLYFPSVRADEVRVSRPPGHAFHGKTGAPIFQRTVAKDGLLVSCQSLDVV